MASSGWFRLFAVSRRFVVNCPPGVLRSKQITGWQCCEGWQAVSAYCSLPKDNASCTYQNGLPVLFVPLPSRQELCQFTLKPFSQSVGDLLHQLTQEDGGIERAVIYNKDDVKVAKATGIDILMKDSFKLVLNDTSYDVTPPTQEVVDSEDAEKLSDVKVLIQKLYTTLNVEQHQLMHEKDLLKKLERLKAELQPLEQIKQDIDSKAVKRTNILMWGGLGYMALQFGFLARLTWWEYSWDIMEPVTYFVSYGTAIAMYAYYVLTKEEYIYPIMRDRQYLFTFHKFAQKRQLDVGKYNVLKDEIAKVEYDIERLQDPLQLNLPLQQKQSKKIFLPELPDNEKSS
ncbi:calcium uniporter protein, mitochondrial-like [Saccoglossus kowalevskii]|uniref:Calcium uniporter protein n=1 Tax=Saccoglossus kowalevskii TaxID=10224 RepID=A0ABM0GV97_SACKO|nr:PREDICTED: calcium uniporter protein, mitochondrial-like [Saccoglossus kowalevskii]